MSPTRYEELLGLVAPLRIKLNQRRESIGPSERLCVTLRYLVIRDSQITISTSFLRSPACGGCIIKNKWGTVGCLSPERVH